MKAEEHINSLLTTIEFILAGGKGDILKQARKWEWFYTNDITEVLHMSRSAASRLLKELVELKLLDREIGYYPERGGRAAFKYKLACKDYLR